MEVHRVFGAAPVQPFCGPGRSLGGCPAGDRRASQPARRWPERPRVLGLDRRMEPPRVARRSLWGRRLRRGLRQPLPRRPVASHRKPGRWVRSKAKGAPKTPGRVPAGDRSTATRFAGWAVEHRARLAPGPDALRVERQAPIETEWRVPAYPVAAVEAALSRRWFRVQRTLRPELELKGEVQRAGLDPWQPRLISGSASG